MSDRRSVQSRTEVNDDTSQKHRLQTGSAVPDSETAQPQITVHGNTKLRYSIESKDKDDALQLNGKEIRKQYVESEFGRCVQLTDFLSFTRCC
jgi:hypothetical protein